MSDRRRVDKVWPWGRAVTWIHALALLVAAGDSPSGGILRACQQSERLALPPGWKIISVEEPFISPTTETRRNMPMGLKARVSFRKSAEARADLHATPVLWNAEDIERYDLDLQTRIHHDRALPLFVGQSPKFRFMFLNGENADELLTAIRRFSKK